MKLSRYLLTLALGGAVTFIVQQTRNGASPSTPGCQVTQVSDGDTLHALCNGQQVKVRLAEIDSPEKDQAFGQRARQSLMELCQGQEARIETLDRDRYGRQVARVYCAGINVNQEQLKRGMAWVYVAYVRDWDLFGLQQAARDAHLGLWRDAHPTPPWEWRQAHRQK